MLQSQVEFNRRFGGTSCLHLKSSKSKPSEKSAKIRRKEEGVLLLAAFKPALIFNLQNEAVYFSETSVD
jgi:hypothetical protein